MFTLEDFIRAVREVAAEQPGKVYVPHEETPDSPSCLYWWQNCPDCIIGHAAARLGVLEGAFTEWRFSVAGLVKELARAGFMVAPPHFECREVEWLCLVQSYQDGRESWGVAVQRADSYVPEVAHVGT